MSLAAIAVGVLMIVFNASVGANEIVLGGGILLLVAGVMDILLTNISVGRAAKAGRTPMTGKAGKMLKRTPLLRQTAASPSG